jgi:hypothetical protein
MTSQRTSENSKNQYLIPVLSRFPDSLDCDKDKLHEAKIGKEFVGKGTTMMSLFTLKGR